MSDRGSTSSSPPSLADQGVGTTQVIDLADIDLSGALPEERKVAPPPLPPEELARASQAPSAAPPSFQPSLSASAPPAASAAGATRSTRFYLVVLAACLLVFVGAGALIARSTRTPSPSPSPSSAAAGGATAQPAGRVITIAPVEMSDDVDASAK